MADYYPLIARAVTGLDKNTGEARRALYERARTALVTQLRGVEPALSEADITRERLALEEAIRKVEAEAARRPRQDLPPVQPVPPPRFEKPPSFAAAAPPPPPPSPPPPAPEPESEMADTPPSDWRELQKELDSLAPPPQASTYESEPPVDEPPSPPQRSERRFRGERSSLVDEGLKGFRDVMAESDDLGSAAASASKSARETRDAFSELPPAGGAERIEPHIEPRFGPDDLKPSAQELPAPPPRAEAGVGRKRPAPPRPPAPEDFEEQEPGFRRTGRGLFAKAIMLAAVLLLGAAAVFAYLRWGNSLTAMFPSSPPQATQASKETPQARPKIADRVGGQQDSRPAGGNAAAVAQRALLYEIGANPQERKQYVGSVIWRTETSSAGPGQPPDMAVKAEVEIPERQMRMSFVVRRNLDQSLPASHTVEILFSTPPDFSAGGVADVAAVLLGETERGAGVPLTGLRVKVTNGFFLVGLSSVEDVVKRNMQLLKTRPWVHLHMIYNNGQPALLLLEKGVPGDRAFEDALNAWGQNPPAQ